MLSRRSLVLALCAVILAGLASRLVHSGLPLLDKYLGDALYSVMAYLLLALCRCGGTSQRRGVVAMVAMTGLELFQLTGIPLAMVRSGNLAMKIIGRLLGTTFAWQDLVAYGVGIAAIVCVERCLARQKLDPERPLTADEEDERG